MNDHLKGEVFPNFELTHWFSYSHWFVFRFVVVSQSVRRMKEKLSTQVAPPRSLVALAK